MPRLRQVSRRDAGDNVMKYYKALLCERDPVAEPGTATRTAVYIRPRDQSLRDVRDVC